MSNGRRHAPAAQAAAPDEEPALFTREFLRCFVALSMIIATTSVMNTVMFPGFDAVFTYARDISVFANSVLLIIIGLVATFRPRLLVVRIANPVLVGCLVGGAVVLALGLRFDSPVALTVAACAMAFGRSWAMLSCGIATSRLNSLQIGACVTFAVVVDCLVNIGCTVTLAGLPFGASLVLFAGLPLGAWALTWGDARPIMQAAEGGEAPSDYSITQPSSFLPLGSQLFVSLFLFRMASGFSLRLGEAQEQAMLPLLSLALVACIAVYLLARRKPVVPDFVVQLAVLLVVAGFLCATLPSSDANGAGRAGIAMLSAGNTLFDMVALVVLIAVAGRNSRSAVALFAWGRGFSGFGSVVGAFLGVWASERIGQNSFVFELVVDVVVLVFVAYVLIGLKDFSFTRTIGGVTPVQQGAAAAPEPTFEEHCALVAAEYGLTPREVEVFQMLARGRDRAYIQEQLGVSRNTVKTHVRSIYAKLDIHTHQDLIDLVEQG